MIRLLLIILAVLLCILVLLGVALGALGPVKAIALAVILLAVAGALPANDPRIP